MITLKELSSKCGVSIATISNVINGKENVSEKTRKLVLEAIEKTGYQPNLLAASLRSTKTRTLGLIVEDITAFSSPDLIDGIMGAAEEKKYRCILENLRLYNKKIFDTGADFKAAVDKALNQLLSIRIDGIIYIASHGRTLDIFPKDFDLPVVFVYAKSGDERFPSVLFDDEKAGYEIVKAMINKGWKKIGSITGQDDSVHTVRRLQGYRKAILEAGLPIEEKLIKTGDWQRKSGYEYIQELVKNGADAVFCQNDYMAAGVLDWLKENNIVPGKDFGVAGFDGQFFMEFMEPRVTSTKIPLRAMGERTGNLIIDIINGVDCNENEIHLDCSFIPGNTI